MEIECFGCGCTDTSACIKNTVPCHWLIKDYALGLGVCSECLSHIEAFQQHQKEIASQKD